MNKESIIQAAKIYYQDYPAELVGSWKHKQDIERYVSKVTHYLQSNPHLLREDGEKNEITIVKEEYREINPPIYDRPTDEQQMEQEAEDIYKKYCTPNINGLTYSDAITALTEFGEMCKQRGRGEIDHHELNNGVNEPLMYWMDIASQHEKKIEKLELEKLICQQQLAESKDYTELGIKREMAALLCKIDAQREQLAEKERNIDLLKHDKKCDDFRFIDKTNRIVWLENELTAAKAEIERLKNENGNLELALKNL